MVLKLPHTKAIYRDKGTQPELKGMLRPGSEETFPLETVFLFEAADEIGEELPPMEVFA